MDTWTFGNKLKELDVDGDAADEIKKIYRETHDELRKVKSTLQAIQSVLNIQL